MLLLNNKQVDYFYFSAGEIQVQLPENINEERAILTWKPTTASDIMLLLLTVNALHEMYIHDIDLSVLYLPYARQDRVCNSGEAFSLKVIINLLLSLEFTTIRLYDVHNFKVTDDLVNGASIWHWEARDIFSRYELLNDFNLPNLKLCAPDKGARKRVDDIVTRFGLDDPVYLTKHRNTSNGFISDISFNAKNPDIKSCNVLVVDDICDGGATFIMAAEELKKHGADKLYLYVTHGIFSKGLEQLLKHYEHIYCHHVLDERKFKNNTNFTVLRRLLHDPQSAVCY